MITTKEVLRRVYVAKDGKTFPYERDCLNHEERLDEIEKFTVLKERADKIECIKDGKAPFGCHFVPEDIYKYEWHKHNYRWYRPKNCDEIDTLNKFFGINIQKDTNEKDPFDIVGEWICIGTDSDYETYDDACEAHAQIVSKESNKDIVEFYEKLGYTVEIKKTDDAVRIRDEALENLWIQFLDTPTNPITGRIREKFMYFPPGTYKKEIEQWFDDRHSKGIKYLLEDLKGSFI